MQRAWRTILHDCYSDPVYQQDHAGISALDALEVFRPGVGPFALIDYEKVYAADPHDDVFEVRGIDRGGALVVVRPDQYVAHVLPVGAHGELAAFFGPILVGTT